MLRSIKNRVNQIKAGGSGQNTPAGTTPNTSLHMSQSSQQQEASSTANRGRANSSTSLAEQQRHLDTTVLSQTGEHLSKFDACVEACDALAASSSNSAMPRRIDPKTGLVDCSVLVSPDGDLLLMPQVQDLSSSGSLHNDGSHHSNRNEKIDSGENDIGASMGSLSTAELGEEYESAVYVGHDLSTKGENGLNGFSANGWSIPATNLALRQTEQSLHDFADFCEEIVLSKKESAARTKEASDKLRAVSYERGPVYPDDLRKDAELMQGYGPFELTTNRVGPMLFNGGTLHAAHVALEEFYTDIGEKENNRWRLASLKPKQGSLPPLRRAATLAEERSSQRQKALREMYGRVKTMEDHLQECKKEAQKRWKEVELGEEKVNKLAQERLLEQHKKREKQRLDEFQRAGELQRAAANPNSAEIWNLVSQLTADMENGGFEPMNMPQIQPPTTVVGVPDINQPGTMAAPEPPLEQTPAAVQIDVDDIEDEVGMHELRAAAFAADRAVQDASGSLLNVLSSLDQLRRSARVAAETNLLSACNSQAECIRSIISLERAAAEEKLKHIEQLEKIADRIDVRRDLDTYIRDDRKKKGGSSLLGDDDDGGVASALAVLTSHVEGDTGDEALAARSDDFEGVAQNITMEAIEEAIEILFTENRLLRSDAPDSEERHEIVEKFDNAVQLLCDVAQEKSRAARPRRSRMCYALNAKRSSDAEIKTRKQFDALCKVFLAILDGCDCETAGGVSNAKMCMMLSQTFFFLQESSSENGETSGRSKRIYVQRRLLDHPLWSQDDFWDQVLFQCLSESLTNSGVMANFEKAKGSDATDHSSEWADSQKTKWFDLSPIERTEAASQVHAVVTAQLGALAHSMIEFKCGLERSCAFVRRMAIRNQLPLSQRSILLQHLLDRKNDGDQSTTLLGTSFTNGENEQENVSPSDAKGISYPTTAATSKPHNKSWLSMTMDVSLAPSHPVTPPDAKTKLYTGESKTAPVRNSDKDSAQETGESKQQESMSEAADDSATGKETEQPAEQEPSDEDEGQRYEL